MAPPPLRVGARESSDCRCAREETIQANSPLVYGFGYCVVGVVYLSEGRVSLSSRRWRLVIFESLSVQKEQL